LKVLASLVSSIAAVKYSKEGLGVDIEHFDLKSKRMVQHLGCLEDAFSLTVFT
jgi:hypothetical protein